MPTLKTVATITSTHGNELSCGSTMSKLTQRVINGRGDSVPTLRPCAQLSTPHINKAAPPNATIVASATLPREGAWRARGAKISKPNKIIARSGIVAR